VFRPTDKLFGPRGKVFRPAGKVFGPTGKVFRPTGKVVGPGDQAGGVMGHTSGFRESFGGGNELGMCKMKSAFSKPSYGASFASKAA